MDIVGAQALSVVGIFASMLLMFVLPFWWVSRNPDSFEGSRYQVAISLANCFSGGVFVATFFIGLMPEVRSMFSDIFQSYKITSDFPITEFVIFMGFLLALAIEQCVLKYKERKNKYSSVPLCNDDKPNSSVTCALKEVCDSSHLDYDSDNSSKPAVKVCTSRSDNEPILESSEKPHNHGHSHDIGHMLQGNSEVRLGMLMISLGVHSLFEGLALGLQTSVPTLLNLMIGVVVHELLVAFAMGVNVSRVRLPVRTAFKLALIFSASIPVGQILGLLIGHYRSATAVAMSATLQGLAAGTFIHVTFLEVIPAEFQEPGFRILKVVFLGLGFLLLLLITVLMKGSGHFHK